MIQSVVLTFDDGTTATFSGRAVGHFPASPSIQKMRENSLA